MDVRKIEDAAGRGAACRILQHNGEIPVAPPGRRYKRVAVEDDAVAEVLLQALKDGEIGRDDDEMSCQGRIGFPQGVEIAPDNRKAHDLCLSRARGELEGVFRPEVFLRVDPERGDVAERPPELARHFGQASDAAHLIEVNEGFNGLPLAEIILEGDLAAVPGFGQVAAFKPVGEQFPCRVRGAGVFALPPLPHRPAQVLCDRNGAGPPALDRLRRFAFRLCPYAVAVRFLVRPVQRLQGGEVDNGFRAHRSPPR